MRAERPFVKFIQGLPDRLLTRAAGMRAATVRSCEETAEIAGLTDESVCSTLVRKGLRFCGTGAFACQPIFSQLPATNSRLWNRIAVPALPQPHIDVNQIRGHREIGRAHV